MTASDRALELARGAARNALQDLDVPAAQAQAIAGVMHLGEHAIDLVADVYRERAAHPLAWARFHETMASTLPRWRWIARGHHRRMARRYRAMLAAGTAIPCTPVRTP